MFTSRKAPVPSALSAPSSTGTASEKYTGVRVSTSASRKPSTSMGTSASTSSQRKSSEARASAFTGASTAKSPITSPAITKGQGGAPG